MTVAMQPKGVSDLIIRVRRLEDAVSIELLRDTGSVVQRLSFQRTAVFEARGSSAIVVNECALNITMRIDDLKKEDDDEHA